MLSIRDISIKNKLVLMQVFTSILVLGLCFAAFVITDIKGYKEREVNNKLSMAQVVGSNSVSALEFLDNETATENLFDLQKVEQNIINARILDKDGNVFASFTKPGTAPYNFSSSSKDTYEFKDGFLYVYKTILDERSENMGTVCLQVELSQLEEIKNQKFRIAAILLIIGLALAFLIAIINQQYISKPLLYLVNMMRSIKENNDYNRHVNIEGKDEISSLSQEFNNLMDEVVKNQQKKDEFIGIAAHELKTPLTSIKLYLELLEKVEHKDPNKTFVLKARDSVIKLQKLILDLLDVSKIQSGQLQLNIQEFNIDELIDECITDAQMNAFKHTIAREGKPVNQMIFADKHRLEQVIINLLSNAIKYSPEGEKVIVQTSKTETDVRVSIKDFGIGIPKSEQKNIFDRFYRAKGKNFGISGFGLGLYICYQIIKRLKGKIWVDSDEDEGAIFYFELPIHKHAESLA